MKEQNTQIHNFLFAYDRTIQRIHVEHDKLFPVLENTANYMHDLYVLYIECFSFVFFGTKK